MSIVIKDGNGSSVTAYGYATPASAQIPVHSLDGSKATYSYSVNNITAVATPTAIVLIQGSATKTVRVKKILIGGAATAAGSMQVKLERWSSAGTAGSASLTAVTPASHDSGNASATAVVSYVQTANYTTEGTTAGLVASARLTMVAIGSAATSGEGKASLFQWADSSTSSIILRGTSEYLAIGGNGSAIPSGGKHDFTVVLEEDAS